MFSFFDKTPEGFAEDAARGFLTAERHGIANTLPEAAAKAVAIARDIRDARVAMENGGTCHSERPTDT